MSAPSGFRERLVRDWYRSSRTPLTLALAPLAWLFGAIAALRRTAYRLGLFRSTRVGVPVVIVGNIVAGGAGKTPLVIALVEALRARGRHPGIVSRGYAGDASSVRVVAADDDPALCGDEPVLLARTGVPVCVGRDRVAAARALVGANPGIDVIVADDGLQHYALARDFEIAVVDGARGLGNGALLPAGPLREPASRLRNVDAVVVNGAGGAGQAVGAGGANQAFGAGGALQDDAWHEPSFRMTLEGDRFVNLVDGASAAAAAFAGRRVHAIAGIGDPGRFFSTLRALGLDPVCHAFPDHHAYTAADVALPDAEVVVMTAKDAIKCAGANDARMWSLPVAARVDPALVDRIMETIDGSQAA